MPQPKSSPAEVSMPTFATLEEWTRSQVQELMQSVLEEEVTHVLGRARYQRQALLDAPRGHRNGYGKLRKLSLTSGTIEVKRPRVRGLDERFESAILPLFARRTQEVGQLLPELYLHGLSQGDFELALRGLLGAGAPLSPSSIARLRDKWIVEYNAWSTRRSKGDSGDRAGVSRIDGVVDGRPSRPRPGGAGAVGGRRSPRYLDGCGGNLAAHG